jgi:hypothetical protein
VRSRFLFSAVLVPLFAPFALARASGLAPGLAASSRASARLDDSAVFGGLTTPTRRFSHRKGLYFSDCTRGWIRFVHVGAHGVPHPHMVRIFAANAGQPVDLELGPDGDLFPVDRDDGQIQRNVCGGHAGARAAQHRGAASSCDTDPWSSARHRT